MEVKKETREFCEYLVKGKVALRQLLSDEAAMLKIQEIVEKAEELRNENNRTIQVVLSEYDEWCELYKS